MVATITLTTTDPLTMPSDATQVASRTPSARRILAAVHTDAPRYHPVLRVATQLATARQSGLTVLSVLEPAPMHEITRSASADSSASVPPSAETFHITTALLERAIVQADPEYLVAPKRNTFDVRVVVGDPDYEIPSEIASLNADVLVIGRGHVGGTGRVLNVLLRGMRAARVCQMSPIPVIAVADPDNGRHPLDTVVIATDLSPASWHAAVTAVQAAPGGAQIHVVRDMDDTETNPIAIPGERTAMHDALTAWSVSLTPFLPHGATIQTAVLEGESYEALTAFLTAVHATCVAVGGHRPRHNTISVVGRTLPERLLAAWPGSIVVGPYQEPTEHGRV